jgi:hypothetical protein
MERTGYLLTGLPCAIALVLIHVTIFFHRPFKTAGQK